MSAWKPLQMPSIRPSRLDSRSRTASVTSGARKKAVMNFAGAVGLVAAGEAAGQHDDLAVRDGLRQRSSCSRQRPRA